MKTYNYIYAIIFLLICFFISPIVTIVLIAIWATITGIDKIIKKIKK